jgi:shikimate kinase
MRAKCILIGFKHVGKSVIGDKLAHRLHLPFVDLDRVIENIKQNKLTCRQLMQIHGQTYFRALEKQALTQVINGDPAVIALGGGALIDTENQAMIKNHTVVHVTANRHTVFDRIMQQGQPAFFSPDTPPLDSFHQLWNEREPIYKKLAHFTIENDDLIEQSVDQIVSLLTHLDAR